VKFPPKFQPGDLARIGGKHRRRPSYYPWLRMGRLVKIVGVAGRTRGGHLEYRIHSTCAGDYEMPSYDLRHPSERLRAPGAGRKSKRIKDDGEAEA
jgi:hypothetical protein